MGKKFFTSDTHFGHNNIIKYENRPFTTVEEMDEALIKNWNSVVDENDEVYILGDFSFHKDPEKTLGILQQLNGRKYLILGNHDRQILKNRKLKEQFMWIKDYHRLKIDGYNLVLFHYPIQVWDCRHHGAIHLYGHVHSNAHNHSMEYDIPYSYNVGADVNDFTPICLDDILIGLYKKWGI